jgi:hypothetical protein
MKQLITLIGAKSDADIVHQTIASLRCIRELEDPLEEGDPPVAYLTSRKNGIQIGLDSENTVSVIFLYCQGKDGFAQYSGDLGSGLSFTSKLSDVEAALGLPTATGQPRHSLTGMHGQWIRYDGEQHSLHFSFNPQNGTIDLVTIMAHDRIPM